MSFSLSLALSVGEIRWLIKMKKIIITGPESTGKTTLTHQLAAHFNAFFLSEYAREYIDQMEEPFTYDFLEVEIIAREQYKREMAFREKGVDWAFCDTGLLVLKIWMKDKFRKTPDWLDDALHQTLPDLYLLTYPDLPWRPDHQREDPGRGQELFEIYQQALDDLKVPYTIIKGTEEERLQNALKALNDRFGDNMPGP